MPRSTDRVLSERSLRRWDELLAPDDIAYSSAYPGPPGPGPVHTVYIPVPVFGSTSIGDWGTRALEAIDANSDQWAELLAGLSEEPSRLAELAARKLADEPIEDLRIDLEDGFRAHRGTAADDEDEDGHAVRSAAAVGALAAGGRLPRSWGLRIRSLAPATRQRGLRTLDLFLAELLPANGSVPAGFVITLPKVTSAQQVRVFGDVLSELESAHHMTAGSLRFEIQVETPQTVLGADGRVPVASMIHAAGGRVSGLHFGTYDYTASLGILGAYQNLRHPVADFAKSLMLLAAAETGVRVSDGSDNKLPLGDPATVLARWRTHADGVRRALQQGIYQGWDLHPAQLPSRFAATFAFFRTGWQEAATRLAAYSSGSAVPGGVLDEPATAFALARHLAAALACGAVEDSELAGTWGLNGAVVRRYLVRGAVPGESGSSSER